MWSLWNVVGSKWRRKEYKYDMSIGCRWLYPIFTFKFILWGVQMLATIGDLRNGSIHLVMILFRGNSACRSDIGRSTNCRPQTYCICSFVWSISTIARLNPSNYSNKLHWYCYQCLTRSFYRFLFYTKWVNNLIKWGWQQRTKDTIIWFNIVFHLLSHSVFIESLKERDPVLL